MVTGNGTIVIKLLGKGKGKGKGRGGWEWLYYETLVAHPGEVIMFLVALCYGHLD